MCPAPLRTKKVFPTSDNGRFPDDRPRQRSGSRSIDPGLRAVPEHSCETLTIRARQRLARVRRLHHCIGGDERRKESSEASAPGASTASRTVLKNRSVQYRAAAFFRGDARDDPGAECDHLLRIELVNAARKPLHNDLGVFINQNGHVAYSSGCGELRAALAHSPDLAN